MATCMGRTGTITEAQNSCIDSCLRSVHAGKRLI